MGTNFVEPSDVGCLVYDIVALYRGWWSSIRGTTVVNRLDGMSIASFDVAAMHEHDGTHIVLYTGCVKDITYFIARVVER